MTSQGRDFEDDVRRVARLLWSDDAFSGAAILDGRERDGIFETRDAINIVESTISTRRDKAIEDAQKTAEIVQKLRKTNIKHINGWLITLNEPTADQRTATQRFSHSVRLLSFDQFRSLLFNGAEYLRCRTDYRFGSVADPITRAALTELKNYVPIDLIESGSQKAADQNDLIENIKRNHTERFVLLGEYGSGKSVTLRNIFFTLKDAYKRSETHTVPIYLNLRDHTGQRDAVEALGRGRIDIITIQNTFRDIAGFPPDEAAQQFILRLPALGPTSLEDSSREFVDAQIADAARAGDVSRFIERPYDYTELFRGMVCPLGEIATNLISDKISVGSIKPTVFSNSIRVASESDETEQLTMDLASILVRSPEVPTTDKIVVRGSACDYFLLDDFSRNFSGLVFDDCLFHVCEISKDVHPDNIPHFNNCLFGTIDGYFGLSDMPSKFFKPDVSSFSLAAETSTQILHADIPEGLKILLMVLRKLFLQPGTGRQESAFYRGAIDSRGARLVPEILKLLAKQGLAEEHRYRGKDLWLPNRRESSRVRKILSSPMSSSDNLVKDARSL